MSLPTLLRVPILALAVASAGCVTTTRTPVDEGSGFGISYDSMYTMSGDMIVWSRAEARETLYAQILLDPLLPRLSDATVARVGVTREGSSAVRAAFRKEWETVIGATYPTVDAPTGPAIQVTPTFVDRVAIDELGGLRANLTADPEGWLPRVGLQLLFSDASTGELVAAAISAKDAYLNELALSGQLDEGDLVRAVRPMIERVRIALDSPVRRE